MQITFTVNDPDLMKSVLGLLAPSAATGVQISHPVTESAVAVEETPRQSARPGTAAALLNDATQPGQGIAKSLDELLAKISMKETQTVTVKHDKTAKAEDYVRNEAGEIGQIAVTYRGNAAVVFENGSAELLKGSELELVPQEDEQPAATNANGATDMSGFESAPAAANETDAPPRLIDADKALALREKANGLIAGQHAKPNEIFTLLSQYGAKKFDELPGHAYGPVAEALDKLTTAADAPEHGF